MDTILMMIDVRVSMSNLNKIISEDRDRGVLEEQYNISRILVHLRLTWSGDGVEWWG
jgi:hypothetical protein